MSTQTLPRNVTPPMFSPASSAGSTPSTVSPTSPRQLHSALPPHVPPRQLRPPKSPLYVPAVLRPTERPVSRRTANQSQDTHPPTPPRSEYSSSDSLATTPAPRPLSSSAASAATATQQRPASPTMLSNLTTTLSLTSTASSLTAPPSPSASACPPPTRTHWKANALATQCDAPNCNLSFSLLVRRHHCRRCGGVFCAQHSSQQVPLDQDAEFDPRGCWSRACEQCTAKWGERVVMELRRSQGLEDESRGPVPVGGKKSGASTTSGGDGLATSVGRDWSWSTF